MLSYICDFTSILNAFSFILLQVYYCPAKAGMFKVTPSDVINDASVVAHGPLPGITEEDALEGVNPCEMYNVLLQVDLTPGLLFCCSRYNTLEHLERRA